MTDKMAVDVIGSPTSVGGGSAQQRVRINIPSDWELADLDGALLAARAPAHPAGFRSNVTVQWSRGIAEPDLAAHGAVMLRRYDGYKHLAFVGTGIATGRGDLWLAEVTFEDEEAGTVLQTHALTVAVVGEVADVFHACGTGRPATDGFDLRELRSVVQSLQLLSPLRTADEAGEED